MPEIVLQSNGTGVDITAAAFAVSSAFFLVDSLQCHRRSSILCTGLAVGLALGTKSTIALAVPGLAAGAAVLLLHQTHHALPPRRTLLTLALAAAAASLLAAPWYVENFADFHSFAGPPQVARLQLVSQPTVATLGVNLLRHLIALIDPAGPGMVLPAAGDWLYRHVGDLHSWLATITGASHSSPALDWPGWSYSAAVFPHFNELRTWFGFTGGLAVYGALAAALWAALRRRAGIAALCAAGATSFLLLTALLLRWQPWQGHLLATLPALCCPVIAVAADWLAACRAGSLVLCAVAMYAAAGGPTAAVLNQQRPLSAWTESYDDQQAAWFTQITPVLTAADRLLPSQARAGVLFPSADNNHWELPFFGPNLTRTLIPIRLPVSAGSYPGAAPFSYAAPFGYLITQASDDIVAEFFARQPALRCLTLARVSAGWLGPYVFYRCTGVTRDMLYRAAIGDQNAGDFSDDLVQLDEIARADPTYQQLLFARGWAEWNLGRRADAIADYRAYLRMHPDDAQAQLNLGYSFAVMNRCSEAIGPLRKALELRPSWQAARRDLAVCGVK